MTIASKTILVDMRRVRAGAPFADVCAKSTIDTTGISSFVRRGNTFFGVGNTTTETYPSSTQPVRLGLGYRDVVAKTSINASEFDVVRRGAPFWVTYVAPVTGFDAARFMIMF